MADLTHGMSSDSVLRSAVELDQQARAIRDLAGRIDGIVDGLSHSWGGSDFAAFRCWWTSEHRPRLGSLAESIAGLATSARNNVADQLDASGSGSGATALTATPEQQALGDGLLPALREARGASPEEQLRWWNSLEAKEQAALLATYPDELTGLRGLPPDVLAVARDNYRSAIASDLIVTTTTIEGEFGASIKIVKVGAGFEAAMTEFADGSVELSLDLSVQGGANVKIVEALEQRGAGATYAFANADEANAFLSGLGKELVPSGGELLLGPWMPADAAADVVRYLERHGDHLQSFGVEHGLELGVDLLGVVEGSAGGNVGLTADGPAGMPGSFTVAAGVQISGSADADVFGLRGDAEVIAEARFEGGRPTEVSFTLDYERATLGGVLSEAATVAVGPMSAGTATITFDLTDPAVQASVSSAIDALRRGDVLGAASAMGGATDRSQIVVQSGVGGRIEAGFDAAVVEGKLVTTTHSTVTTMIKPPGGSFYEVRP